MAEDDLDDEGDAAPAKPAADGKADKPAGGKGKLMPILVAAGALVVGLLGGGAGGYFLGGASAHAPEHAESPAAAAPAKETPTVFVDLPRVQSNLASSRCRGVFITLEITAGVGDPVEAAALGAAGMHIKDRMTDYLRTVTKEDLDGREGSERLRSNVEAVINDAIQPVSVREVLFKEFVVQ